MYCMPDRMPRSLGKKGKNDPWPSGIDSSSDSSAGNSRLIVNSAVKHAKATCQFTLIIISSRPDNIE